MWQRANEAMARCLVRSGTVPKLWVDRTAETWFALLNGRRAWERRNGCGRCSGGDWRQLLRHSRRHAFGKFAGDCSVSRTNCVVVEGGEERSDAYVWETVGIRCVSGQLEGWVGVRVVPLSPSLAGARQLATAGRCDQGEERGRGPLLCTSHSQQQQDVWQQDVWQHQRRRRGQRALSVCMKCSTHTDAEHTGRLGGSAQGAESETVSQKGASQ